MKKYLIVLLSAISFQTIAQQKLSRPKLVVGIVVDQMRLDYIYRYYDRLSDNGFKRMLKEGFSCENTFIRHLPSYTAVGHSTIFTGSVPSIHGITGNNWIDQATGKNVYCTDDSTVQTVGSTSVNGKMSPRNLLASTVTDELMLATNFQSKVVGVSLKDRASILPAGHAATGAFWFDDASGNFISSTWYMQQLPEWAQKFNDDKQPEKLVAKGWDTYYPINTYKQSTADDVPWEGLFKGEKAPVFPHDMATFYKQDHDNIRTSPFGNTLTLDFAKAAVNGYGLGTGSATDFLTINCASTDYVGHKYGPNSIEIEDVYIRLDKDLATFFSFLDTKVGKGNYTVFLSADHGASHAIGFMKEHKIPADLVQTKAMLAGLNAVLAKQFGQNDLVLSLTNYYVNFDMKKVKQQGLDIEALKKASIEYIEVQPGIQYVVDVTKVSESTIPAVLKEKIINGYNRKRCGLVTFVPEPGWFEGPAKGTTHGTWNAQDVHIPLLFMGWGIKQGASTQVHYMTDIAPTISALLHIQMPNGSIGEPITEVQK
ncbi:MAG: alkaline phosphatase family protein [Filimonas sp.]|nr:alkaline phosphatase family protein [Filimonas sp.]